MEGPPGPSRVFFVLEIYLGYRYPSRSPPFRRVGPTGWEPGVVGEPSSRPCDRDTRTRSPFGRDPFPSTVGTTLSCTAPVCLSVGSSMREAAGWILREHGKRHKEQAMVPQDIKCRYGKGSSCEPRFRMTRYFGKKGKVRS